MWVWVWVWVWERELIQIWTSAFPSSSMYAFRVKIFFQTTWKKSNFNASESHATSATQATPDKASSYSSTVVVV